MATLGSLSNDCLIALQQPGASYTVGTTDGGGPNWASVTNPQFGQGLVEYAINEWYRQLMGELEDLELSLVQFTFSSTATTYKYAIPPSGYANISHVARVYYKPSGLPYTREFLTGERFISWRDYQAKYTGSGYLLPYAFGTEPTVVTVDPQLQNLYFFPGSAIAGDTITVQYSPIPTQSGTGCPTLVAAGDTPILPLDCHIAIFYGAMSFLWVRAREANMVKIATEQYRAEVAKIRAKYTRKTHGDYMHVQAFQDSLSLNAFS